MKHLLLKPFQKLSRGRRLNIRRVTLFPLIVLQHIFLSIVIYLSLCLVLWFGCYIAGLGREDQKTRNSHRSSEKQKSFCWTYSFFVSSAFKVSPNMVAFLETIPSSPFSLSWVEIFREKHKNFAYGHFKEKSSSFLTNLFYRNVFRRWIKLKC